MRRLVAWWEPEYEPERIDVAALNLPDKAKSKRVKGGDGESFQAELLAHRFVLVKHFWFSRRQHHMDLWFHSRHWPKEPFEQSRFVSWLYAEMCKRVFDEDDQGGIMRYDRAVMQAVNEVLGLCRV